MTLNVCDRARCAATFGSLEPAAPRGVSASPLPGPARTSEASAAVESAPAVPPQVPSLPQVTVEPLVEFTTSGGLSPRVDRRTGRIFGVKVLGLHSRNGRMYRPEAIAAAAPLYENVKVNVNHPQAAPHQPRDYQDRLGCLRNVRATTDGLFGDLYFNPHHHLADQLAWDAEHAPENVGLSHNVQARTRRQGNQVIVEAIEVVRSVDLVADPATTHGLYEGAAPTPAAEAVATAVVSPPAVSAAGSSSAAATSPAGPANPLGEAVAGELEAIRLRLTRLEALQESRSYRPVPVGSPLSRGPEPPREAVDVARWARSIT